MMRAVAVVLTLLACGCAGPSYRNEWVAVVDADDSRLLVCLQGEVAHKRDPLDIHNPAEVRTSRWFSLITEAPDGRIIRDTRITADPLQHYSVRRVLADALLCEEYYGNHFQVVLVPVPQGPVRAVVVEPSPRDVWDGVRFAVAPGRAMAQRGQDGNAEVVLIDEARAAIIASWRRNVGPLRAVDVRDDRRCLIAHGLPDAAVIEECRAGAWEIVDRVPDGGMLEAVAYLGDDPTAIITMAAGERISLQVRGRQGAIIAQASLPDSWRHRIIHSWVTRDATDGALHIALCRDLYGDEEPDWRASLLVFRLATDGKSLTPRYVRD